jgi:TetR/AcrR family transcriptional regulator, mexJK operon transcriptional repressor
MATKLKSDAPRRTRGRPRLGDVAAIEDRLLDVALNEFVENGYGATSLTRIVKVAEISKTTLYSRYPSKEDLFRAIIRKHVDLPGADNALRPETGQPQLEVGLKAYANRMLDQSLKGGFLTINRLIFGESHRFPELGAAADERTEVGISQVAEFIEECARVDGVPCADPRSVAEAFIMLIRGWYLGAMVSSRKVPAGAREQWVERAVRIFVRDRADWCAGA